MVRSQDHRQTIFLGLPPPPSLSLSLFVDSVSIIRREKRLSPKHLIALGDPDRPESRSGLVEEKLTLYIGVWLYYATFSWAPGAKARTRNRQLQNFIVCHAEINNKTDFISYDLYNIFLPQGSRILVMSRSSMCVCVYMSVCMYELRALFLSSLY